MVLQHYSPKKRGNLARLTNYPSYSRSSVIILQNLYIAKFYVHIYNISIENRNLNRNSFKFLLFKFKLNLNWFKFKFYIWRK